MTAWRVIMLEIEAVCGIRYSKAACAGVRGKRRLLRDAQPILSRVWARVHRVQA